jgi:hypothetical protein
VFIPSEAGCLRKAALGQRAPNRAAEGAGAARFRPAVKMKSEDPLWVVKALSRSQWDDGYGADCGRSRGGSCRSAIRPIEASKDAVCYVR